MPVDRRQVEQFVKNTLKNGTPKWISHPEDYREMVKEWHAQAKENLLAECHAYKCDDQDFLAVPRRINPMTSATFLKKLRGAGFTCFSHDSQDRDGTASLFVLVPTLSGGIFRPTTSIQVPLMWEWSTIRLDPQTQLPCGFRDIGWRSVLRALIGVGILTEDQAHAIFGEPREGVVSRVYRRLLCELRNGGKRAA